MRLHPLSLSLMIVLASAACAPRPATPSPEEMAATVNAVAFGILTQTAAAASPTPAPTATSTPLPPATDTPPVTVTPAHQKPITKAFAGCYFGPGPTYTLSSNINPATRVEFLGTGSVQGWYVILNPYFRTPCWMEASNLEFDPGFDIGKFPVMTPMQ